MTAPRILAFAGSTRTDSWNKKLVRVAADAARAAGAEVTLIDLRDFPLPLFDEDLEKNEGTPAKATELKQLFFAHRGLLLSSPEYNANMSAVLKNAFDWVSRQAPGEKPFAPFTDKVAGLMSASPGALGGLRGLVHVRALVGHLGMIVLPQQVAVMKAHEAFNPDGTLKDARQAESVARLAASVASTVSRLEA